jgi:hypothetical protein
MKLLRLSRLFLMAVLASATWACQKSNSSEIDGTVVPPVKETVQTSIQGRVLDEHEQPMEGATVTCGGKDTTTDVNGNFLLQDVKVVQDAATVSVSKTQHISGVRTLIVNANSLHYVQIMLHDREATATFSSTAGGTISLPEGELTIPANNILQENNTAYNGIVDVNFKYINPQNDRFPDLMAGDLRGISKAKTQVGLRSYGMLVLELSGQNGEKLHLNKPITVKSAIPGSLQGSAPAQITLWSFNVSTGYWEEDGTASKQGDFYVSSVKSTGYWHCAVPYDLVSLQTKIVDQHNDPVPNLQVVILTKLDFIPTYSYTDAAGRFTGKVPNNTQLIITFTDPCKDLFFHQEIGPFAAASVINNLSITLPLNNILAIDGLANNCSNQPVQKGVVSIMVDGLQYATPIENGHYKMTILRCSGSAANVTFNAKDAATNVSSVTTINANNGNISPTLVVCTP